MTEQLSFHSSLLLVRPVQLALMLGSGGHWRHLRTFLAVFRNAARYQMPARPRLRNATLRLFIFWGSLFEYPMESMDVSLPGEDAEAPNSFHNTQGGGAGLPPRLSCSPNPLTSCNQSTPGMSHPGHLSANGAGWTRAHPARCLCPAAPE